MKIVKLLLMMIMLSGLTPAAADIGLMLTVRPMLPDNRGTDVRLIRDITVDAAEQKDLPGPYVIVFYIDGRFAKEFTAPVLPYVFQWNFKGMREGTHTIRVELMEAGGDAAAVLATIEGQVEVDK